MIVAPHRHRPGHELADLTDFLAFCRKAATERSAPVLASVTLPVAHIDPLAVLLKMRRPGEIHYYRECPAEDTAVAALDTAAVEIFSGRDRFLRAEAWVKRLFDSAFAAGDAGRAFGGPHAFLMAEFADAGTLTVFVPARLVARRAGEHTASACVLIGPSSDPAAEAERMLGAHARFAAFEYGAEDPSPEKTAGAPSDLREGEAAYASMVRGALAGIAAGEYTKIVPVRAATFSRAAGFDTAEALERLRAKHPAAHTFSFSTGDGIEWAGATPETLLRISGGKLYTEALAGTGPRARHAGEDARLEAALLADEKIRREQRTVTDTLALRLGELGLRAEFSETPRIVRLAHTRHLLTPVSAGVKDGIGALTVAGALHPTPAVAGAPRDAALAGLEKLGDPARGHFAGASGWIDAGGDAHLVVNLRCAAVCGATATLFAGAGIIAGSVPEEEATETTLKLRTIAEALA